ncbi:hypothetical protein D3C72_1912310 [compost metagenome]
MAQIHAHAGKVRAKGVHDARKGVEHGDRRGERNADLSRLAQRRLAHDLARAFQMRQRAARLIQKQRAGLRQFHAAAGARQQRRPQFFFQRLDLQAQRRLADVQPAGGLAEAQFLGDGDEVAQLAEIHIYLESK